MAAPSPRDRTTVSVVIPVKDDDAELARCLAALSVQTRVPDEIIVVDNGSTDASAAVARDAGARVEPCDRPGIPAASAHGYDRASGDLILRLDADCIPDPDWVAAVVDAFDRAEIGAVTGGARFLDGPRALRAPLAITYLAAYDGAGALALGHRPLFGSNLALRREAWRGIHHRVHRDDAAVHDDFDLSFHLGERWRIGRVKADHMAMSMRPFADPGAFARRVRAGFRTVVIHWPHDVPPVRWVRIALRRAGLGIRVRQDRPLP
ncbi:glycosyltransferase family 2 protein [Microbacterium sp. BK668]|uniref:glycosyltransferase n=1 Tax=Microbacterium sp. BK668 TaxID=2512118 RepID=UPI00105DD7E7|nr:glycosyltransferase family 2 protein [Microbacterium sp. BK668]TDN92038.1 glycosyl transferase family 2 [Microbacterium sp. BK668]